MTHSQLFQKIERIQIMSGYIAKSLFIGAYRSAFKGRGMEFEEVREYAPGDEVRHIDWNVTARMNHPYIKTFREERDLTVMLLVDISASTHFGGKEGLKSTLIAELSAVLAFSAIKNNDRVGLLLFSDRVEKYIPPKKGSRHVLRLIRELLSFTPQEEASNIQGALSFLGKVQTKTAICFLISDFLFSPPVKELSVTAKKNDLIGVMVSDSYEYSLPPLGIACLKDIETGKEMLVDMGKTTSTLPLNQEKITNLLGKIGADMMILRTDQSYILALKRFFKMRKERKR